MRQGRLTELSLGILKRTDDTPKNNFIRAAIDVLKNDLQSIVSNGESLRYFSNLPQDVCGVLARRSNECLINLSILEEILFSSECKSIRVLVEDFVKLFDGSGLNFIMDVAHDLKVLLNDEQILDLLTSAVRKINKNIHFFGTLKISARKCKRSEERLLRLQPDQMVLSVEAVNDESPRIGPVEFMLSSEPASTDPVLQSFCHERNLFLAFIPTEESEKDNLFIHPSSLWGEEKILVIDPDSSFLFALRNTLPAWGYHVAVAECGELALMEFENENFDVLVMNFDVLGMTASVVLDKALEVNPETRVIAIGGNRGNLSSYVSASMTKPFKTNALLKAIRKLSGIRGGVNGKLADDLLLGLGTCDVLGSV